MGRPRKVVEQEETVTPQEDVKVEAPVCEVSESAEKKAYREFIATYAKSNPAKYEVKKTSLLAKLEAMN